MSAILSPSVHEAAIARHFKRDTDDPHLQALHDGVKSAREVSSKIAAMTSIVLKNTMKSEAARHAEARNAGFDLLRNVTETLDAASKATQLEIDRLQKLTQGPAQPKDGPALAWQSEIRQRLANLPEARRNEILDHAAATGDDATVAAVTAVPPWVLNMSATDVGMIRRNWATKKHAAELDRLERLRKALSDTQRAGSLALSFVDGLTDSQMIEAATASEKAAQEALKLAKG